MLCRVAEIYERRLGDPNGALVTLQAALEQDPTSGRVVQEMERVARSSGCWKELVAITAEVAGGLEDPKQAADLWVQIAFWDESGLGMPDEAANAARAALNLAPNHGGALALLEDLYKRQRNWDSYVEILNHKHQLATDDPYKLREAFAEVLRYEPQHAGALTGLARICEETHDWEAAADALRKLIAALPPALEAERLLARHRLGAILKDRLGDVRGAEEQLVEVLAAPGGEGHVPSMLTLAAIYRERRDWLKARQLLVAGGGHRCRRQRARAAPGRGGGDLRQPAGRRGPGGRDLRRRAAARSDPHRHRRQAGGDPFQAERLAGPAAAGRASGGAARSRAGRARKDRRREGAPLVPAGARRRGDGRSAARGGRLRIVAGGAGRRRRRRWPRGAIWRR